MSPATLLLATLIAAGPIEPTAQWTDSIADESLREFAPEGGVIADAPSLKKVWNAWRPDTEVPAVDFASELLIVVLAHGPNKAGVREVSLDEKGDLRFEAMQTAVAGPGFGYLIFKVDRKGIKSIDGKPFVPKIPADKTPLSVPIPVAGKGKLTTLERKLAGAWIGQAPCVGRSVFQSDGTYHRLRYGPGDGSFESGKWTIEWSELPPTLVLNPLPTEVNDNEEPWKVQLIKLNDKQLDFRWTRDGELKIEKHLRGTDRDDMAIRINILDTAVEHYRQSDKYGRGVNFPPHLKRLVETNVVNLESLFDSSGNPFQYDVSGKRNKGERPDIWIKATELIGNWSEWDE